MGEKIKMSTIPQFSIKKFSRIGNLIPVGKLTLITGLPGTGKSYSTIKFLNKHDIKPLYLNLDESDIDDLDVTMYGPEPLKPLIKGELTGLSGEVMIIDTYSRLEEYIGLIGASEKEKSDLVTTLEHRCIEENVTIIIIGHPEDYVGKASIFKDNQALVRKCAEHIHLDCILPSGKKNNGIHYRMFIKKGRGIGGVAIVENWMRDETKTVIGIGNNA